MAYTTLKLKENMAIISKNPASPQRIKHMTYVKYVEQHEI